MILVKIKVNRNQLLLITTTTIFNQRISITLDSLTYVILVLFGSYTAGHKYILHRPGRENIVLTTVFHLNVSILIVHMVIWLCMFCTICVFYIMHVWCTYLCNMCMQYVFLYHSMYYDHTHITQCCSFTLVLAIATCSGYS